MIPNRVKQKDERTFWKRSVPSSVLGQADYTKSLTMVKVTFLLTSYGDIIAEQ
jgi:hypothetical protein